MDEPYRAPCPGMPCTPQILHHHHHRNRRHLQVHHHHRHRRSRYQQDHQLHRAWLLADQLRETEIVRGKDSDTVRDDSDTGRENHGETQGEAEIVTKTETENTQWEKYCGSARSSILIRSATGNLVYKGCVHVS